MRAKVEKEPSKAKAKAGWGCLTTRPNQNPGPGLVELVRAGAEVWNLEGGSGSEEAWKRGSVEEWKRRGGRGHRIAGALCGAVR